MPTLYSDHLVMPPWLLLGLHSRIPACRRAYSGFQVYVGPRMLSGEEDATENLARYIIRTSFFQERLTYFPEGSKVLYQSKDRKIFGALDWLAAMTSHVPNKGCKWSAIMADYSNAARGLRQKKNLADLIPSILLSPSFYPDPIYPTDYNRISKSCWVTPGV